jgi:hypothetical protein
MKAVCCFLFISLGLAFCVGCGDNSSQSWEDSKSKSSASKSGSKSADVANNDSVSDDGSGDAITPRSVNPHAGTQMAGAGADTVIENDGKLDLETAHWTVPKTWVRKSPGMMLLAEFAMPKAEGDAADVRLTVSQLGGTVDSNLDRWKGQFSKLDKQNQESFDLDKLKVTLIDLSGVYNDSRGMTGPSVTRSGYRMLGAVVEVPGQSTMYFLKCYGPEKTIAAHADEIKGFIRSMKIDKDK